MHKASGGEARFKPANWLRTDQASELIKELTVSHIRATEQNQPLSVLQGGTTQGTYVCKELVYAYAMWISAKFHLQVIRTFDALMTGQIQGGQHQLPQSYAEALRALADTTERAEQLDEENAKLTGILGEAEPKLKVYDAIMNAEGLICIDAAAKLLNVGPLKFRRWLRSIKFLRLPGKNQNLPMQSVVNSGFMVTKESYWEKGGYSGTNIQPFFTQKGLAEVQGIVAEFKESDPIEFKRVL